MARTLADRLSPTHVTFAGGSSPSPAEAAAAIAAVERFRRDHAGPATGVRAEERSAWVEAARAEAVERL